MAGRSEELTVTVEVASALEALHVPYLVGGSIASSLLGIPRATLDVDLVADLRQEHVSALVMSLEGGFYIEEGSVRDAVRRRACFNVIHLATMFKVDIFVMRHDALSMAEMARRQRFSLPGAPPAELILATAEDIVLQKRIWYRLGQGVSDRQWRDVIGVLEVQGEALDLEYLARWAAGAGVADLLESALDEAALPWRP